MNKKRVLRHLSAFFACLLILVALQPGIIVAQTQEPDVMGLPEPKTPLSQGKHNTLGFKFLINNFGFGIGGQYSRILGPFTELTLTAGITGIRDVSEQNFQDFFTGQQIIPNKYNRAVGFPLMVGLKRRLFARHIADNFRFFVAVSGGPALSFVYPYLDDVDGNGFRNLLDFGGFLRLEPVNDFFTGWKDGDSQWGAAGNIKLGVDIGENFSKLTTVEFGYFFYYFDEGIQIMEPNRPVYNNQGQVLVNPDGTFVIQPFFDKQKYFGSPQITLIFGGMW